MCLSVNGECALCLLFINNSVCIKKYNKYMVYIFQYAITPCMLSYFYTFILSRQFYFFIFMMLLLILQKVASASCNIIIYTFPIPNLRFTSAAPLLFVGQFIYFINQNMFYNVLCNTMIYATYIQYTYIYIVKILIINDYFIFANCFVALYLLY